MFQVMNFSPVTPITEAHERTVKQNARPMLSAISAVLRTAREERRMSQLEVARRSGLHRTYVCEVERGTRNPSLQSVIHIAAALNTSASELIKRAEELIQQSALFQWAEQLQVQVRLIGIESKITHVCLELDPVDIGMPSFKFGIVAVRFLVHA